jgi:pimeloyl-ACP methyl ester carboxylesterase
MRVALGFAGLLGVVALSGWGWQSWMEAKDDQRFPPPGAIVDVDGRRMHIHCQGEGTPVVVVEQGIGAQSLSWSELNWQMSGITTVCAYDRAGMGYSDPVKYDTRSVEVARDLHRLLAEAGIDGDIVLVGWSAGGIYSREYYRQFPDKVKGMVLVDSAHEQQAIRMPPPQDDSFDPMKAYRYLAPLGWVRASGRIERLYANAPLPAPTRERLIAVMLKSHMYRTLLAEGDGFNTDLAANKKPPSLGDIPLVVLSEGKPNIPFMQEKLQVWFGLQEELARLSTNGKHIVATKSAHAIHRTEPELIYRAVQEVVAAARSGGRLGRSYAPSQAARLK